MNFSLSEEQLMVRNAAREFALTELKPGVIKRDELQEFPDNLVKKMGALGFMGIMVEPKYGGSGMDSISYVLIMEELSKIDASAFEFFDSNLDFSDYPRCFLFTLFKTLLYWSHIYCFFSSNVRNVLGTNSK